MAEGERRIRVGSEEAWEVRRPTIDQIANSVVMSWFTQIKGINGRLQWSAETQTLLDPGYRGRLRRHLFFLRGKVESGNPQPGGSARRNFRGNGYYDRDEISQALSRQLAEVRFTRPDVSL